MDIKKQSLLNDKLSYCEKIKAFKKRNPFILFRIM